MERQKRRQRERECHVSLVRIEDAAAALGVPAEGLRRAAEQHGYLIRIGRARRKAAAHSSVRPPG